MITVELKEDRVIYHNGEIQDFSNYERRCSKLEPKVCLDVMNGISLIKITKEKGELKWKIK